MMRIQTLVMSAALLAAAVAAADVLDETYDVVVVGGTSYGVAAALEAQAAGAKVMVIAPRPYLGEDVAAPWRLLREKGDDTSDPLYAALYPERADDRLSLKGPLALKHALDVALETAKIPFRTWTPVYDVARDAGGRVVGVRIVNRSGRRVVRARLVVDATVRAWVSQRAGVKFAAPAGNEAEFTRMVVSGDRPEAEGLSVEPLTESEKFPMGGPWTQKDVKVAEGRLWKCTKRFAVRTGSAFELAEVEQKMREATWTYGQLDGSDTCRFDLGDRLLSPAEDVLTLGPRAGTDYLQPGRAMVAARKALRARIAAAKARTLAAVAGEDSWTNPAALAEADTVVAGVGTGGAPAAIAAGRAGLRTVALEFGSKVGGLTTDGMIGGYWYGNVVGFTTEIDEGTKRTGLVFVQAKEQWFRHEIVKAGVRLVFGAFAADVVKEGDRLAGVVAVLPDGSFGTIRCRTAVDATGNADLAAAAGDPTEFIGAGELAVQGAAFTRRKLGLSSMNVDFTFVNDADADDLWYLSLRGRNSYQPEMWDQAEIVSSRERRRIRGLAYVTPQDVMLGRTWPDTVVITRSNFDTHGQTIGDQFFIEPPPHTPVCVNLPYRALLPQKTDGLIVIGLGLSAHRDAMPILRMQPDVQNQGWVAGTACALALKSGSGLRALDVKALQRAAVAAKILPEVTLGWSDSLPLPDEAVAAAVRTIADDYKGLAAVYAERERALPLLRTAWREAMDDAAKLRYAHVLGIAGDATGAETLAAQFTADLAWDEGWNYRGMGQFGRSVSWLDSYLIALGRTRSKAAFGPIRTMAEKLMPFSEYSHFRAVALAFEALGDERALTVLADLLALPGVGGHAFAYAKDGAPRIPRYDVYNFSGQGAKRGRKGPSVPDYERTLCLRELSLARALYNLGDLNGLGERTLRAYAEDPRRAYAAHARAVLSRPAEIRGKL